MDIDHFKDINDTHGHTVAITALKELATLMKPLRKVDFIARWGGEANFFDFTDRNRRVRSTFIMAERLRNQIASHAFCLQR